jgi:DNA-binding CsgD family transcriptional regulator
VEELTELEVNVLKCAHRGRTIRETAEELHYSAAYVKQARSAAMRKLGASGIVGAVSEAMRRGLLELHARA